MGASVRPIPATLRDAIARAVAPQSTRVGAEPWTGYQPSALERALTMPLAAATNPAGAARDMVIGPIRDAVTAVLSPSVGELPHDPRLSKGGNAGSMTMAQMQTPYTAETGGVTDAQRLGATARLVGPMLAGEAIGPVARGVASLVRGDPAAYFRVLEYQGAMPKPEVPSPLDAVRDMEIPYYPRRAVK